MEAERMAPSEFSQPWPKEVCPVPPYPTPIVEPFQVPEVMVPTVELLETIKLVVEAVVAEMAVVLA